MVGFGLRKPAQLEDECQTVFLYLRLLNDIYLQAMFKINI